MAALLAFDTSTPVGSVAVGDGDRVLAEVTLGDGTRHSEALLGAVQFALAQAKLDVSTLDGLVVGAGPGSFTGVRIAGATARGLVRATGLPFFAYSSLLALAVSAGLDAGPVCALLDARRGEVYAGCFGWADGAPPEVLLPPQTAHVDVVVSAVAPWRPSFAGEGAIRYRAHLPGNAAVAPAHRGFPRAASLLWLASRYPAAGRVTQPARWEPAYLRASGAERGVRG